MRAVWQGTQGQRRRANAADVTQPVERKRGPTSEEIDPRYMEARVRQLESGRQKGPTRYRPFFP